jgi:hypothetical protein
LKATRSRYPRKSVSGVTFGFKFVQDLASKRPGFSGESTAFRIGEAKAPPTQALLEESRPGELHPQPLAEPYVKLSPHTAPIVRPLSVPKTSQ